MLAVKFLLAVFLVFLTASSATSSLLHPSVNYGYFSNLVPYYTCTLSNAVQCQQLCIYQSMCFSFNYVRKSKTCHLYKNATQDLYINKDDARRGLLSQRTPEIISAGCDDTKVCVRHGNEECRCFPFIEIDCGSPKTINGSVVNVTSTKNNGIAAYTCQEGYRHVSGTGVSTCLNSASWSHVDIICLEIDCGPPKTINGSEVNITSTRNSGIATYICQEGYRHVSGTGVSTCLNNGSWSHVDIICLEISCGPPPVLNGSEAEFTTTKYDSTVIYTCNEGYEHRSGSPFITCLNTGDWSSVEIKCTEIDCGTPPEVKGSDVTVTTTTYNSTVTYTCQEGYGNVGGSEVSTCLSTSDWSIPGIICSETDCGPPPDVDGSDVTMTQTTYNNMVTYSCCEGYEHLGGSGVSTCLSNGNWSSVDFICSKIDCGPPPVVNGSDVDLSDTTYNSSAIYTCLEGYDRQEGSQVSTCLGNASWSTVGITCTKESIFKNGRHFDNFYVKVKDCGIPAHSDGAFAHYSTTTFGSTVVYTCIKDQTSAGNGTSVCTSGGNWTDNSLTCTASLSSNWELVATTTSTSSSSSTPSSQLSQLISRLSSQCKPSVKVRFSSSSLTRVLPIHKYGIKTGYVWAQSVHALTKSSWDSFDQTPRREFWMFVTTSQRTSMTLNEDGSQDRQRVIGDIEWFVNTDQCLSSPYSSSEAENLIEAVLSGSSPSYESMFHIGDNKTTLCSQQSGELSQTGYTFHQFNYWFVEKRTTEGDNFIQRWFLLGGYLRAEKRSHYLPWCVDMCWQPVINSSTKEDEKERNIRHLVNGVRHGRNILIQAGSIVSSGVDIYLHHGHVTVSIPDFWEPATSVAFSDGSRKVWLTASTKDFVRKCTYIPESADVDTTEEIIQASAWFIDSRTWRKGLTTDRNGNILSGSRSRLVSDLKEGRSLRVGISHTNDVFTAMSIDNIDFSNHGHIAAEAIDRVNLLLDSDSNYNFTNTCQLMSSIITTEGSYKKYMYNFGKDGTHVTVDDVSSIDWFVGM